MELRQEVSKKVNFKDILSRLLKNEIQNQDDNVIKKVLSEEEIKEKLLDFVKSNINLLQEEGNLALDYCEDEGNYHIFSYWIEGTYIDINNFINEYSSEYDLISLRNIVKSMYPYDLAKFNEKLERKYHNVRDIDFIIEGIATILLKEFQYYPQWYTIYGTEEEDYLELSKYNIDNALNDKEEFPVMKNEDIVAAMYGINTTVQPSDLYDVFAHYADELKIKKDKEITLFEEDVNEESIFTPDNFLMAAVVARWKNYTVLKKSLKNKVAINYIFAFNKMMEIEDVNQRNSLIVSSIVTDYIERYSVAPNSLPLHRDMLKVNYINDDCFSIEYRIRGIKDKKVQWDNICTIEYSYPKNENEYQDLIFQVATDFRKYLYGLEKQKNSNEPSYEGKYPQRFIASHGLTFIKDLNVQYKNNRGIVEKKVAKPTFTLAMAEKQSTYFIKKSLRYGNINPVLSTSFGIDSTVTQHLLRRVAKHSYNLVHNDSRIEYPELIKFKKFLIKEWEVENRITTTYPVKDYWTTQKEVGWNFARKGDRRNGQSPSEVCCNNIKHIPMYNYIDKLIEENNPMLVNYSGLRGYESLAREKQVKRDGIVYYAKSWKSIRVNPIAWYTDDMIWEYVRKHNVPYCEVYDMIVYYEDVFENVSDEEIGKIYYKPRVGCYPCIIRKSSLLFLKKFYPKQYNFLMFKKEMAKEIFIMGAKKLGIIADFEIVKDTKKENPQISMFDTIEEVNNDKVLNITSEDIMKKYPIEAMENMIMKRPCKFL